MRLRLLVTVAVLVLIGAGSGKASEVISFSDVSPGSLPPASVFLNAKPMKLPMVKRSQLETHTKRAVNGQSLGPVRKPSFRKGFQGGPIGEMVRIVSDREAGTTPSPSKQMKSRPAGIGTMAYGESGIPFSTSRVELNTSRAEVTRLYPYRATGRLAFRIPGGSSACSAALIDKGILLTAAHCVTEYGGPKFSGFTFIPGFHKGQGAYGTFSASRVYVTASYANGTDICDSGVVCMNDVAIVVLKPNAAGRYPGQLTGWFGVGMDGYGFTSAGETQITQLGYPSSLDSGRQMIRNDSMGYADRDYAMNTVIGSSMDSGSSGGPWVANLGSPPRYVIDDGEASDPNMIIGVTSWGYDDGGVYLEQGSSALTSENVGMLWSQACRSYPAACSTPR
jgi:V8-like Glu-specific endopeptidase